MAAKPEQQQQQHRLFSTNHTTATVKRTDTCKCIDHSTVALILHQQGIAALDGLSSHNTFITLITATTTIIIIIVVQV